MYHVEISSSAGSAFRVKSKDYEFVIDTKGSGVTPPDTLLARLGSCIGVYLRKYAEGAGLPINDFTVTLDADLSKEAPVSFRSIRARIDLKGFQLDERRKQALLGFIKNCPVGNTLKANPAVDVTVA